MTIITVKDVNTMRDREIRVNQAVENNIAWCRLVCAVYDKSSYKTDKVWGLHTKAPTYYPELITANRTATEEDILEFLKLEHIGSVKDSYATLHLEPFGYQLLFEAEWICHPAYIEQKSEPYDWRIVRTEKELERWTKTTGLENSIPFGLLGKRGVKIFFMDRPDGFAGFIANVAANVIGISNVFSCGMDVCDPWLAIPHVVSTEFPGIPLVGYEHGDSLSAAHSSGWKAIGPLRVWIKSS